jgi:branched-chain amino acid transport system ATP-binding protein
MSILQVQNIEAGYNTKPVLHGVSVEIDRGGILGVVGPNGSGKSTLLKAIFGILKLTAGKIIFDGREVHNLGSAARFAAGIGFCPQGNRVFEDMTVEENFLMGGFSLGKDEIRGRIKEVLDFLPALRERQGQLAGTLSGGEKQMLAFGRALMTRPKLLLLDEPSLGLAPNGVKDVLEKVAALRGGFGMTIIIVEQKVRQVAAICDRIIALKMGRIFLEGKPDTLMEEHKLREAFLW